MPVSPPSPPPSHRADVCIISSWLYSERLSQIAGEHGWSYLATGRNNVCAALNAGILHFPNASWIYKIDEDIFVTKHFFQNTMNTYLETRRADSYYRDPVFVAPVIPLNRFGYAVLLNRLGLTEAYEKRFGPVHLGGSAEIETDPEAAKFLWGDGGVVPPLDETDEALSARHEVYACPFRFSIGAILMERRVWAEMGCFVSFRGTGMGADETELCVYGATRWHPMVIAGDTCVGHLSFTEQNAAMKTYYLAHPERFRIGGSGKNDT